MHLVAAGVNPHVAQYTKWRKISVDQLKGKLQINVVKRKKSLEDVVTRAADRMAAAHKIDIMPNYPPFQISPTITSGAVERMEKIIESWPGVQLNQCKKPPPIFKKYWRTADNWWNRQKGKWFGDLIFQPILSYSLRSYCKKILLHKDNTIERDYVFFLFLRDILGHKVSFKKARPNPLIFDLVLDKSPKIQEWFGMKGTEHGVPWELTAKAKKKAINEYAVSWAERVLERKSTALDQFKMVNAPTTGRSHLKRGGAVGLRPGPSSRAVSPPQGLLSTDSVDHEARGSGSEEKRADPKYLDLESQVHFLRQQQAAQQAMYMEHLGMLQQRHQVQQQQIWALQQRQQRESPQSVYPQHLTVDPALYFPSEHRQYPLPAETHYAVELQPEEPTINQPEFLPQPNRYSPPPSVSSMDVALKSPLPLPPPLKAESVIERRRRPSYHDVVDPIKNHRIIPVDRDSTICDDSQTTASQYSVPPAYSMPPRECTPGMDTLVSVSTPTASDVSVRTHFGGGSQRNIYTAGYAAPFNRYNGPPLEQRPCHMLYGKGAFHGQSAYYNVNGMCPLPAGEEQLPSPQQLQLQRGAPLPPPKAPAFQEPSTASSLLPPPIAARGRRASHGSLSSGRSGDSRDRSDRSRAREESPKLITPTHSNRNSVAMEALNEGAFGMMASDSGHGHGHGDAVPFDLDVPDDGWFGAIGGAMNPLSSPNTFVGPQMLLSPQHSSFFGAELSTTSNPMMGSVTNMSMSTGNEMSISAGPPLENN